MSKPRTIKGYHFQADLIRSLATIILCYFLGCVIFSVDASCNNNKNYLYNIFLNIFYYFHSTATITNQIGQTKQHSETFPIYVQSYILNTGGGGGVGRKE